MTGQIVSTYHLFLNVDIWIYTRLGHSYRLGVEKEYHDGHPSLAQLPNGITKI